MEKWKSIKGFEGLYEVSDLGRVRSIKSDTILKGELLHGYKRVALFNEKYKKVFVHRLVADAFIPNPDGLPQINHKDEDKTNNCVDNLEWCTSKYNMNYGSCTSNQINTKIKNGLYDPSMCGMDRKEYKRKYRETHRKEINEYFKRYRAAQK